MGRMVGLNGLLPSLCWVLVVLLDHYFLLVLDRQVTLTLLQDEASMVDDLARLGPEQPDHVVPALGVVVEAKGVELPEDLLGRLVGAQHAHVIEVDHLRDGHSGLQLEEAVQALARLGLPQLVRVHPHDHPDGLVGVVVTVFQVRTGSSVISSLLGPREAISP